MANPYFKFKQFTVRQDKCAMKVGTDGVLLGAWVSAADRIKALDIGTGTGLIALMLAQKGILHVDAIDIDFGAFEQAVENVKESPFDNNIAVFHSSLESFAKLHKKKYDLIVSNPPYFHNSLKGPDEKRNIARHNDSLSLETLITDSLSILKEEGKIVLILPFERLEAIEQIVINNKLFVRRQTNIIPTPNAKPKRFLIEISRQKPEHINKDELTIELTRHQYTPEYIQLTKDFYLNM